MRLAEGHDVVLIEEHERPGVPVQCAGLITPRGVPEFAAGCILSTVRGARIHSPLGHVLTLEGRSPKAHVVDRAVFDRILFERAVDRGAVPMLGTKVLSVSQGNGSATLCLKSDSESMSLSSPVVVGADGYRSVCRKASGLPPARHMLTGIQVDLKGADHDLDFVDLYLGNEVAPGFFAWAIPGPDFLRVGLCTWRSDEAPAAYLKRLLARPEFASGHKISSSSGRIPVGPGKRAVSGSIVLIGDAACHAKPLSGGGVFTGIRGAELCATVVDRYLRDSGSATLDEFDRLWMPEFGRELAKALRIRKVFVALSDKRMDKALRMFDDPSVRRLLEDRGDIDYPASLSSSVLKMVPKLAQFSPELIESLL
jgi:geranylgeranyl reductase family protein